jgi:hypothetical protein
MTRTKDFDCVEMKRRGSLEIHERLAGLSAEEQVEYWRKRAREFRDSIVSPSDRARQGSERRPSAEG